MGYYILEALLYILFNIALFIGIQLTSPVFMSFGTLLSVPVFILIHNFMADIIIPWVALVGMIIILLGFLCVHATEIAADRITSLAMDKNSLKRKIILGFVTDIRLLCWTDEVFIESSRSHSVNE